MKFYAGYGIIYTKEPNSASWEMIIMGNYIKTYMRSVENALEDSSTDFVPDVHAVVAAAHGSLDK